MNRSPVVTGEEHAESPTRWYARLSRPKVEGELTGAILRCFDGTDPTIVQPALDENLVAIHLGGAKRVHRWRGRMHQSWEVPSHAITLMPAFRANRWHTEGVIAFAHLTLSAGLMARLARDEFDRDPGEIALLDQLRRSASRLAHNDTGRSRNFAHTCRLSDPAPLGRVRAVAFAERCGEMAGVTEVTNTYPAGYWANLGFPWFAGI